MSSWVKDKCLPVSDFFFHSHPCFLSWSAWVIFVKNWCFVQYSKLNLTQCITIDLNTSQKSQYYYVMFNNTCCCFAFPVVHLALLTPLLPRRSSGWGIHTCTNTLSGHFIRYTSQIASQTCWMGLRSGDCGGHGVQWIKTCQSRRCCFNFLLSLISLCEL